MEHHPHIRPSMSQDELSGLLHAKQQFRDESYISRFIFRPFWRNFDAFSPNWPPGVLLIFSLFFSSLNLVLLTLFDRDFSGTGVPRWIYAACFLFQFAGLACSWMDVAGRLNRHEKGENLLSSAEYLDRILESWNLFSKCLCCFHIIGVGNGGLSPESSYLLLVLVLACCLCQQWEANVTGTYHSSLLTDSIELAVLVGFVSRFALGMHMQDFLRRASSVSSSSTNQEVLVKVLIFGVTLSFVKALIRVGNTTNNHPPVNFDPVIAFGILTVAQFFWTTNSAFNVIFPYILWTFGVTFSNIMLKSVLDHFSSGQSSRRMFSMSLACAGMSVFGLMNMLGGTADKERYLFIFCSGLTVWHGLFSVFILRDLVAFLMLALVAAVTRKFARTASRYFGLNRCPT